MENEVNIVGQIIDNPIYSHEYQGINYYVCTVRTEYIRKRNPVPSFIRIYIPEAIAINSDLAVDVNIEIKGRLINSNHDGHKDVSVVADEITITDKEYYNYAKLTGVISRVFTNESNFINFVNFLVSTSNTDKKRTISLRVVAWSRLAYHIFNNFNIGDKVTVTGAISSSVYDPSRERSGIDISDKVFISELYCTACTKQE